MDLVQQTKNKTAKISIIGSGRVGATSAWTIAHRQLGNVVLVDVVNDLAKGIALDISQSLAISSNSVTIQGTSDFQCIQDSDVVVVAAGIARKPGMNRLDLLAQNMQIIRNIFAQIIQHAPGAIMIVVTNPVDLISYYVHQITSISSNRLLGMAGVLDSGRLKALICQQLSVHPDDVSPMVLGGHGDTMLVMPQYSTVSGVPISQFMSDKQIQQIIYRTQHGGAEIVNLLKRGSAYFAPASSVANMVQAILGGTDRILTASCLVDGEYGVRDVCLGCLIRLGKEGIHEIIKLSLTSEQSQVINNTVSGYQKTMQDIKTTHPDFFEFLG